jgi:hypothetical protein
METVTKLRDDKVTTTARVSVLENQVVTIAHSIEKLEVRVEDQYKTLHTRISDLRDDVRGDIDSKHEKLVQKIDEHSVTSSVKLDSIEEKISAIEKWRWMIMGAAIVVGYVLAHVKLENIF